MKIGNTTDRYFVDTDDLSRGTYYYRIEAVNSIGSSKPSSSVSVTIIIDPIETTDTTVSNSSESNTTEATTSKTSGLLLSIILISLTQLKILFGKKRN